MSCQYCGGSHSAFDPCPEMLAAASATVNKHTLGTRPPVNVKQIDETVRVVESLMRNTRWVLISPNGDMWAERDPKKLVHVLLTRLGETRPTVMRPELGAAYGTGVTGRGGSVTEAFQDFYRQASTPRVMSVDTWKAMVRRKYLNAQFTEQTDANAGETHGEVGTITAHCGPDMQSDVVGVWVPGSHCSMDNDDFGVEDGDNSSFG